MGNKIFHFHMKIDHYKLHLQPNVDCKSVTIPETKKMVEMIYPFDGSSSSIHSAGVIMKGIAKVAPTIVK